MIILLHAEAMQRALARMGHEIVERNEHVDGLVLVGLQTRGVFLARRLADKIREITGREAPTCSLDISLYRDDLNLREKQPRVKVTDITFDLTDKSIVLVDDVLCTGRTIRAALDALIDFGRPQKIQLAVLVDRGHRELPIRPDYVGKNVPTAPDEKVRVRIQEQDGAEEIVVVGS